MNLFTMFTVVETGSLLLCPECKHMMVLHISEK
jgi:hypothetical protein